ETKILLIDLRDNPGGSEAFALDLMGWFAPRPYRLHRADDPTDPRPVPRFEGKIFVLVNRNSFSSCAVLAAAVQDQHFGLILGERTSDLATGQAAIQTFELDNSHLVVGYPTSHMVRIAGEDAPRFVLPDLLIDTPVIEGPEDPVLRQALDLVTLNGSPAASSPH
ncbi:MAG TPA: S41 family peptidase, partial [Magnetospirillaceae bacterium]|nr:S41 family peptidase [Magnetospirillaceae bacterium]